MLERLATYDEMFRRGPVGRYAVAEHFLIWCTSPELCGLVMWGQPAATDLRRLAQVFDHGEASGIAVPCDYLADVRRLERIDASVFAELVREVEPRRAEFARRVRRQAVVVRPGELSSAVVSGFYALAGADMTWHLAGDLAAALAWLEAPDAARTAAEIERLVAAVLAGAPVVDQVRAWLRDGGLGATLSEVAAGLATSARSLQRRLGEAGTSFRAELEQARLAEAKRLLLDTDHKVATIAEQVGASSESNFIAFFRRLAGVTPAAWRAGGGRGAPPTTA